MSGEIGRRSFFKAAGAAVGAAIAPAGPSLPGSASIGLFGEAEPQGLLPLKSQKLDFGVIRVQVVADEALAEMRAVAAMYGFVPSVRPPLKRPRPPLSLSGLSEFESRKRAHKRI